MSGILVLVATPIGNLGDLSPRAREELDRADVVCCEDTRRTAALLRHAGIRASELRRLDDHTEYDSIPVLLERMARGDRVVLVSDAGTPSISDPGYRLVAAAVQRGLAVTGVPGPVAAVHGLVLSGLATDRFCFEGFLIRRGEARATQLAEIAAQRRTTVFYESPHRLADTLRDLASVAGGDRPAAVARELTKLHEEIRRGTLDELADWADEGLRGEVVVVLDGAPAAAEASDDELRDRIRQEMAAGQSRRDAVSAVANATGTRRGRVYDLALTLDHLSE